MLHLVVFLIKLFHLFLFQRIFSQFKELAVEKKVQIVDVCPISENRYLLSARLCQCHCKFISWIIFRANKKCIKWHFWNSCVKRKRIIKINTRAHKDSTIFVQNQPAIEQVTNRLCCVKQASIWQYLVYFVILLMLKLINCKQNFRNWKVI